MRRALAIAALLTALCAVPLLAQATEKPLPSPVPTPDFSKERLRFTFSDYLVPPPEPTDRAPAITVLDRWGWVFKYIPIFLGNTNDGSFGHANPMTPIDPLYMTNNILPYTKKTMPPAISTRELTLDERSYRRSMIKVTIQANEAEQKK